MTRCPSPAVFLAKDLEDFLAGLDDNDKIKRWIEDMTKVLKEHMYAGDIIGKKLIPNYYINRYGVNNLYRYSHPEGFRSCYTVFNEEGIGVCPHVLDIMSHEEYEKRFGYRKSR
jgi:hypothetical protein